MEQKSTKALKKNSMSLLGIVVLVYAFIAAGAFGIEEAIASSGPGVTLAMLLIFPFVWSIPLGEMVAELGSLYPTEGGIYSWAREAFGEFWGWQVGLWSALTTWLCQAEYCALVAGYLGKILPMAPEVEFGVKIAMVLIFTAINIAGLDWMEKIETVLIGLVLIAFAAVTVVGIMNWNCNPVEPFFNPDEGLFHSVGEGIAIIIWMYLGYECMSNMAEEVDDPQQIPRAMRISQPLICLSYVLPTLAALAAIGRWDEWSTEQGAGAVGYADVLIQYVGNWAGVLFVIVAIFANCAIFCSYIAHGSRAFFVMADDDMFPKFMRKVDKRGIPTISILILAVFTIFTCQFDFTTLVMATNPIQLYMYIAMIAVIFKLRKIYPVAARKAKGLTVMAGGNAGLIYCSACVFAISIFAIYVNGLDYFVAGFLVLFLGLVFYMIFKWYYKGRYNDDPVAFPLSKVTKLGLGDMMDIGVYTLLTGLMSLGGSIFLYFYEIEYGVEYYLEEYEEGFFSNWEAMISFCRWLGIALIIIGIIVYFAGKKFEGESVEKLRERQIGHMDKQMEELHGFIPR